MSKFLKEKYNSVPGYVPGEQLHDREYIKINTNEFP